MKKERCLKRTLESGILKVKRGGSVDEMCKKCRNYVKNYPLFKALGIYSVDIPKRIVIPSKKALIFSESFVNCN